jgi:anti-anti-sigma regulatory factor
MVNLHVLPLSRDIDISQRQWIEHELAQIERFGPKALTILDLSAVRYLDTTFLNALLRVWNRVAKAEPQSCISIVTRSGGFISRLFEIAELDGIFHLYGDVPSATARMLA